MNDDFIITIHALERFEQRFPEIAREKTDQQIGELIHAEVMEALDAGRKAKIPPIELASYEISAWEQRKPGFFITWVKDKTRGYALVDDPEEGMLVKTVLYGEPRDFAMRKLRRGSVHQPFTSGRESR